MAKTEINTSGDNGSLMWSKTTYWDTGSHFEGWQWWSRLKRTPVITWKGWCGLREHTGTLDQSAKGDNSNEQDWNHHQQLQGKNDMVRKNLLGHLIRVWRAMMVAKIEMNTSGDKGIVSWSERTCRNTRSECKWWQWWKRLKWTSVVTMEAWHGLRQLTGTLDLTSKGGNGGQDWKEHQWLHRKGDVVWENVLGHLIRAQKVTMAMNKTEITVSNYKERMTWSGRTYWDTWSECEGWQWWPRLKWMPVMMKEVWPPPATTRQAWCGLRKLTGTHWPECDGWWWWPRLKWTTVMTRKGW